ncbi:hypothetical protein R5R35_013941 [Gryllus longicercus]|uniref:ABC transporter domain-containing protein n=1 Tax=Gryllus longicercus TaxID=2509291 RepID=A0AAN9YWL4_9ORTH
MEPLINPENLLQHKMTHITVTWNDVSVWYKKRKQSMFWKREQVEYTQVLKNVCGIAKSGHLLAIMGASGAGKTSLLATISMRVKGAVDGEVLINGKTVDQNFMAHISGFVPQQDLVINSLTVQEHMEFMASLKMDSSTTALQRRRHISALLSELGLAKCQGTKLSLLSGGEEKRLSLAVQLLNDPLLLFCDEPTTGLDSYSASIVVEKLSYLAQRGKAVVCTIHQPASGLFDMFSHVLLLADGRVAFYGDTVCAAQHFRSLNLICPKAFNRAEFYISQLSIIAGREQESKRKVKSICDAFESSTFGHELAEQLSFYNKRMNMFQLSSDRSSRLQSSHSSDNIADFQKYTEICRPGYVKQLYWLTWRNVIHLLRNSSNLLLRAILYLFIALILATPYTNLKVDQTGIQNVQGLMYLIVTETIFTFSYSVFHTFPSEIPILLREIANGIYKPGPYYISKMLVLIPRTIVEPFLYSSLIFWIADLQGDARVFLLFCLTVIMCAKSSAALGCVMSAAFESVATASLLSVPIDFLTLMFSGLFLQLGSLPAYLSWLRYVSQFYYGTEAISILQWEQIHNIKCPDNPELPCISSGRGVLEKYDYGPNNFSMDLLGLFAIYSISHMVGFLAIWIRSTKQPIY